MSLEVEDHDRDAAFSRAMHKDSAKNASGLLAAINKDKVAQKAAVDEYFKHWDHKSASDETSADRKARREEYATLTRQFAYGEPFHQAIARHEHYLAAKIGIKDGDRVLDVGCGVGGPAREIAKFTGAHVTGLNNNDYQIERATRYARKEGLSHQLRFVKGDFMQMSLPDDSFDNVYAIEATVHAPSLEQVYSEIFRVLKPGGIFGVYEWLMTDKYDNDNPRHREIRLGIELGDGISNMVKISDGIAAIKAAGFELLHHEDLALRPDPSPWYYPLAGDFSMMGTFWDFPTILRMTKFGRGVTHKFVGFLETLGLAPDGTQKTADSLTVAADSLVAGAKEELFTPMYLMIAQKPSI